MLAAVSYFVFFYEAALTNRMVGQLFVASILSCLLVFLIFKFGLHYKIYSLNKFVVAFYYSVFEYKKTQLQPSDLSFMESVREQGENCRRRQ